MTSGQAVRSTDEIREEIVVRAEPARVWRALTDPAELLVWWGDPSAYRCTGWTFAPVPGAPWRVEGTNARGGAFRVEGEILEAEPPGSLGVHLEAQLDRSAADDGAHHAGADRRGYPAGLASFGFRGLSPSAGRSSGRPTQRGPLARTVRGGRLNLSAAPVVVCRVPRSPPQ